MRCVFNHGFGEQCPHTSMDNSPFCVTHDLLSCDVCGCQADHVCRNTDNCDVALCRKRNCCETHLKMQH